MTLRAFRGLFLLLLAGLALVAVAPTAGSHALLKSSEPADGATLEEAPDAVTLVFTEQPDPTLSDVKVVDQDGRSLAAGPAEPLPDDPRTFRVPVEEAADSVYTVTWNVVSRVDGHRTAGVFAFGVGIPPLEVTTPVGEETVVTTPPVSALEVAGRWVFILGLVALLGSGVIGLVAFGDPPRAVRLLSLAAIPVAATGLGLLAEAQRSAADVGLGILLETPIGRALTWRAAALGFAVLGALLAAVASGRWRRTGMGMVALGAAGAILAQVAAGHAAAAEDLQRAKIAAQWIHFSAVGVWIGGLAALLLGVRGVPDETKARAVRRFSATAGVALLVVAATGVVRAVNEVESLGNLFSTGYGRIVVVKIGLLLLLAGLGAANRYRNVPRAGVSLVGLRRVSRAELTLAAGVLAATALLTSLAPPGPPAPARAAEAEGPALVVSGSDFATAVEASLEVRPGLPGNNRFLARVTDFDTGEPIEAERVILRFALLDDPALGESTLRLRRQKAGTYGAVGSNLSLVGHWGVEVLVQQGDDSFEVPLVVGTRCRAEAIEGVSPPIYESPLPEGGTVQMLAGGVGGRKYEIHFTFLRPGGGDEIRIKRQATITAWRPDQEVDQLRVGRLGPGHFVGDARLQPGMWRFQAVVSLRRGAEATIVCFENEVGQ